MVKLVPPKLNASPPVATLAVIVLGVEPEQIVCAELVMLLVAIG